MSVDETFLTDAEIKKVTGRIRPSVQFRILLQQGISATQDGDGKPIVYRRTMDELHQSVKRQPKRVAPDFDAIK